MADLRAVWAAEKSCRRSHDVAGGGWRPLVSVRPGSLGLPGARGDDDPVPEPRPAVPRPMPGLSSAASASGVGGASGRDALARVGRAGSLDFFGESGGLAIGRIWGESGGRERAASDRAARPASAASSAVTGPTAAGPDPRRPRPWRPRLHIKPIDWLIGHNRGAGGALVPGAAARADSLTRALTRAEAGLRILPAAVP